MELPEAIELIRFKPPVTSSQRWADLGCGSGLFTKALASLLPPGSTIQAVDKNEKALRQLPENYNGSIIEKLAGDFTSNQVVFHQLNGLLMANSLHFIPYKESFLRDKFESLKESGLFLLVEYDLKAANQWVPYPVPLDEVKTLFNNAGFRSFELLRKKPSVFGSHYMYAVLAEK